MRTSLILDKRFFNRFQSCSRINQVASIYLRQYLIEICTKLQISRVHKTTNKSLNIIWYGFFCKFIQVSTKSYLQILLSFLILCFIKRKFLLYFLFCIFSKICLRAKNEFHGKKQLMLHANKNVNFFGNCRMQHAFCMILVKVLQETFL